MEQKMSQKTRIKGFTAWGNLRLRPYDHFMNNVLVDLMSGTNMKMLMNSLTGRDFKRIQTFEGITQQQKITRVQWATDELIKCKLLPSDVHVDSRMFSSKGSDHALFGFLWHLVSNDIWFVWERAEFLQHESDEILAEVPFKWVPEPPPVKKKPKSKTKSKSSLMMGFGNSSVITEQVEEDGQEGDIEHDSSYEPFPGGDYMKMFKVRPSESDTLPKPFDCILEILNKQLKTAAKEMKLVCQSLRNLADTKILCTLANSFVPNLFPTEILLNDRWTMNLVLRQMEKMFYAESTFSAEDLVEGDLMNVSTYLISFLMLAYKYRQSKAVVDRMENLQRSLRELKQEADQLKGPLTSLSDATRSREVDSEINAMHMLMDKLKEKFDMEFCTGWVQHVNNVYEETHEIIHRKIEKMFDITTVPKTTTLSDFCSSFAINLSLTQGTGFYLADGKEMLADGRRLVLRDTETGKFIEEFISKNKQGIIKKTLGLPLKSALEINPLDYPRYEFYFESSSKNKQMKSGSGFLYQVFPGSMNSWHKLFLKAAKQNELDVIKRMVTFFKGNVSLVNCKEAHTGNSPLHLACRYGHYDVALYLLENWALIDQKNATDLTALFSACEGLQKECAWLLLEWGCDVHVKGPKGKTAFEMVKHEELRDFLIDTYKHYSDIVPKLMTGNVDLLRNVVMDHLTCVKPLSSIRSRFINGSTALHTASYFNCQDIIKKLLKLRVDVSLKDYKGATPLHRARNEEIMKLLLDAGATVSTEDLEGNTPLHVKCYGDTGEPSQLEAIKMLLAKGVNITARNIRNLMPIHCCAMQGRTDAMHLLLEADPENTIREEIESEQSRSPPSLLHLALANDYLYCAVWLVESGFSFKSGETDSLLRRILTEQIEIKNKAEAIKFLMDQGAIPNQEYSGGNTALHYAASALSSKDVLEVLIAYGADINAINKDKATPLFFACQANNQFAASCLLNCGANFRSKNIQGLTAFDYILDYDEWIECGYFSDEIVARLKAYSLKHARDLIRAISKKVKRSQWFIPNDPVPPSTAHSMRSGMARTDTYVSLPPITN